MCVSLGGNLPAATPPDPFEPLPAAQVPDKPLRDAEQHLHEGGRRLANVRHLLQAYPSSKAKHKEKLLADLAGPAEQMGRAIQSLTKVESSALKDFRTRFAGLKELPKSAWRVALEGKPVMADVPEGLSITRENGNTLVAKYGGRVQYHLCVGRPLLEGDRIAIKFSIGDKKAPGSTPVPYIGLRDEQGGMEIFFNPHQFRKADEIHHVLVECNANGYIATYDRGGAETLVNGLELRSYQYRMRASPPHFFFAMNDVSEVVVHNLRANAR